VVPSVPESMTKRGHAIKGYVLIMAQQEGMLLIAYALRGDCSMNIGFNMCIEQPCLLVFFAGKRKSLLILNLSRLRVEL
jgi:hypothetical protein